MVQFYEMVNGVTRDEDNKRKSAEAARKAVEHEIEDACKGDIATVEAARDRYLEEQRRMADELIVLNARAEVNQEFVEPARAARQRGRDVGEVLGYVGRRLDTLRQERGERLGRDWAKSPGTAALVQAAGEEYARSIEALAALVNSYEAATNQGAHPGQMLPLPADRVLELKNFDRYVASLKRWGIRLDAKNIGPAAGARVEAARS